MNDLDAALALSGGFAGQSEPNPAATPKKCRRHDYQATGETLYTEVGASPLRRCIRCGVIRDEAKARRGRNNRNRGNSIERDVAHKLGLKRVGQYGTEVDAEGDWLVCQVKSGGAFSERIWSWLNAMSANASQTRIVVLTDAPGPGRRRRAMVVTTLEEWIALHHGGEPHA